MNSTKSTKSTKPGRYANLNLFSEPTSKHVSETKEDVLPVAKEEVLPAAKEETKPSIKTVLIKCVRCDSDCEPGMKTDLCYYCNRNATAERTRDRARVIIKRGKHTYGRGTNTLSAWTKDFVSNAPDSEIAAYTIARITDVLYYVDAGIDNRDSNFSHSNAIKLIVEEFIAQKCFSSNSKVMIKVYTKSAELVIIVTQDDQTSTKIKFKFNENGFNSDKETELLAFLGNVA